MREGDGELGEGEEGDGEGGEGDMGRGKGVREGEGDGRKGGEGGRSEERGRWERGGREVIQYNYRSWNTPRHTNPPWDFSIQQNHSQLELLAIHTHALAPSPDQSVRTVAACPGKKSKGNKK